MARRYLLHVYMHMCLLMGMYLCSHACTVLYSYLVPSSTPTVSPGVCKLLLMHTDDGGSVLQADLMNSASLQTILIFCKHLAVLSGFSLFAPKQSSHPPVSHHSRLGQLPFLHQAPLSGLFIAPRRALEITLDQTKPLTTSLTTSRCFGEH